MFLNICPRYLYLYLACTLCCFLHLCSGLVHVRTLTGKSTRAIVFSHFRDSVQEIVKSVNSVEGIQARCFIGQGGGKADKTTGAKTKGMTQQEQKRLVQDFFNGHFNVLVATCIAEEGLDIGEVDLIVNYDTHKSPIRMVQRMGRTARKRSGVVKTLLSSSEQAKLKHSLKQVGKETLCMLLPNLD